MLAILGPRRRDVLKRLLWSSNGATVLELAAQLGITGNAVRQHLAALENDGLVSRGEFRPTAGRPEQLYVLTDAARELFPRHYGWFARLIVQSIKREAGAEAARQRLGALGAEVARQLLEGKGELETRRQRVQKLNEIMAGLGYETASADVQGDAGVIEAHNCVFHHLAMEDPDVCAFDLALLSTFADSKVDHQECMAKGGHVCRFKFSPKR